MRNIKKLLRDNFMLELLELCKKFFNDEAYVGSELL